MPESFTIWSTRPAPMNLLAKAPRRWPSRTSRPTPYQTSTPKTSKRNADGRLAPRSIVRFPQPLRQHAVEMIPPRLALDTESAGIIRAAFQATLHFLTNTFVFHLHL